MKKAERHNSSKKKRKQPTCGIDASLSNTAVVSWNGIQVVKYQLIRTENPPPNARETYGIRPSGAFRGNPEERIHFIKKRVRKHLKEVQPKLVAIEGYSFTKNSRAGSVLHELGGVLKDLLLVMDLPFVVVPPRTNKLEATGSGNASKIDMIFAAKKLWAEVHNDNLADAFFLSKYSLDNYKTLVELNNTVEERQ